MKTKTAVLIAVAALLFMGAKGCSNCEKATAAALATCQATGEESEACKMAKAEAAKVCAPDPEPTPTPTPTPPPATCSDGLPPFNGECPETCDDLACPYGCDDTVRPNVCKPKPPEPPLPPGCQNVEEDIVATSCDGPQFLGKVKAATDALGDLTGNPPAQNLERLAAKLREVGLCAFAGIEAVFILRSDAKWEENHAVFFGNGSWTGSGNGKFMGCHRRNGDPEPPPVSACPAPQPPRVWTAETLPPGWGENAIGTARWTLNCKPHGPRWADCTPVVNPWACDYCASIGMGELSPGVARCGCPVRPDGHPDRVACESLLTGGVRLEARNGADCGLNPDNPFQFTLSGGNCRLCSVGEPTVCGPWL